MLDQSPALKRFYFQKLQETAPPWHVICGFDEFSPGSKINAENRRKHYALYFNFAELGGACLSIDSTWFTPVVLRSKLIESVAGGWSCCLRLFLRQMLLGPQSLSIGGVIVQLGTNVKQLQAKLGSLITDGEGWQKAIEFNGHSSMRPCFAHCNVFRKDSGMEDDALGYVDITCSDYAKLRPWPRAQFRRTIDTVLQARDSLAKREAGWNATRLANLITHAGFKPTPQGILADVELCNSVDIMAVSSYDWMHVCFQDGAMSTSIWLVLEACSQHLRGNYWCDDFVAHLDACQFPLYYNGAGRGLHRLFSRAMVRRHKNGNRIVANASHQFMLYPLVRDFAVKVAKDNPPLQEDVAVFVAACKVIDLITAAKYNRYSTRECKPMLLIAIQEWQDLHKLRYGTRYFRPKFVWLWAIARKFADQAWVFDMWTIERLHRRLRPQAELVKNLTTFEESVLFRVVDAQVCDLRCVADLQALRHSLVGTRELTIEIDGVVAKAADKCCSDGRHHSCDDIVVSQAGLAAIILACILSDGRLLLKVELLRSVGKSVWARTTQQAIWLALDVTQPTAWRQLDDGRLFVIV